jgi:O-antigen/teichoic acid export membrane protein
LTLLKKLIPQSLYARNVITLMTGTGLAQAIPIAITPILTRLYTPEDFGLVALFVACASVLSILATGRYELAITLPESDKEAANILVLSLKLCAAISLFLIIPIAVLNEWIALKLGNSEIAPWLYLLPISVIGLGAFNAMQMWLNRCGLYKQMSVNRLQNSGYTAAINLGLGIIKLPVGQIWAATFGPLLAALIALRRVHRQDESLFSQADWEIQKKLARRYQHHPKHILPGQLIGAIAVQIPIFIMSSVYSLAIAGFFALAYRLVVLPTSLIANAIGDVYRQRIAREYQEKGEFRRVYFKTVKTTAMIALPVCVLMYLFAPTVFSVIFGKEWVQAGEYAKILVVAVYFQMTFTPVDKGAVLVGATKYIFIWHLGRFLSFLCLYLISENLNFTEIHVLWIFVVINICLYSIEGFMGFKYANG